MTTWRSRTDICASGPCWCGFCKELDQCEFGDCGEVGTIRYENYGLVCGRCDLTMQALRTFRRQW